VGTGRYRGRLKIKHGEGFGLPMLPENNNFLLLRCVGKRNFPHEMGLPRWELQASRKAQNDAWKGLGCPCFSGMGWEGFRMV